MHQGEVERLYRSHGHLVLRRAAQILGNESDAHEVLQELFMSLIDRPDQFRGESAPTTFLYSATTHLCLNRLRNRRTRLRLDTAHVRPATEEAAPADAEQRALLRELLGRLPDELARAAVYCYCDGMTHDEIGVLLGCSRRQVGNLLERCQEQVRRLEPAA